MEKEITAKETDLLSLMHRLDEECIHYQREVRLLLSFQTVRLTAQLIR